VDEYHNLVAENQRLKDIVATRLPGQVYEAVLSELKPIDDELEAFSRLQQTKPQLAVPATNGEAKMDASRDDGDVEMELAASDSLKLSTSTSSVASCSCSSSSSSSSCCGVQCESKCCQEEVCECPDTWPIASRILDLLQVAEDLDRQDGFAPMWCGSPAASPAVSSQQKKKVPAQHQTPQRTAATPSTPTGAAVEVNNQKPRAKPAEMSRSLFDKYNLPLFMGVHIS
jgi:hypothetical protein